MSILALSIGAIALTTVIYPIVRHLNRTFPRAVAIALVGIGGTGLLVVSTAQVARAAQHEQACYKHDPPTTGGEHGALTADGTGVILNPFNPAWTPWDHWESLEVKGGPNGSTFIDHPQAGVAYYTPGLNPAGQRYAVSHWTVCKGRTPTVATTIPTETTAAATTTILEQTTTVAETTTTAAAPTTSEAPASTPAPTSTTPPDSSVPVSTIAPPPPPNESVCDDTPAACQPATTPAPAVLDLDVTAQQQTLPETGRNTTALQIAALVMLALGLALVFAARRPAHQ